MTKSPDNDEIRNTQARMNAEAQMTKERIVSAYLLLASDFGFHSDLGISGFVIRARIR